MAGALILASRLGNSLAFGRRCIPPDGVAHRAGDRPASHRDGRVVSAASHDDDPAHREDSGDDRREPRARIRPRMQTGAHPGLIGWCLALSLAVAAGAAAATTDGRLASAMKNRDKASVRSLLTQRVDVNAPDVEGMTALHWAAHWDDLDTVKLLLRAGAKAKVANRYGVTPLHEAATLGSAPMIETLLKAGADPNAAYGEGETALMAAARTGSVDAVKMLLTFGASVDARETFRGETALMYAVAENHADVVKLLIELRADVNAQTIHYEFPKLTGGNGGIIHDRPEGGLTPIFFAARQGAIATADLLIAAGADLKAVEPQYGFTPMQTAIFNGHYDLAARLIDKGADVNDGSLYTAVEMRNLARYSNRPNPPDTDKELSSLDVIKRLLAHGADPNRVYTKKIPPRQAQGDIVVTPGRDADHLPRHESHRSHGGPSAAGQGRQPVAGDQGRLDTADDGVRDGGAPRRHRGRCHREDRHRGSARRREAVRRGRRRASTPRTTLAIPRCTTPLRRAPPGSWNIWCPGARGSMSITTPARRRSPAPGASRSRN